MITFGGSILKYGSQWLTDVETPPVLPLNFQPGDLVFRTPETGRADLDQIPQYWGGTLPNGV